MNHVRLGLDRPDNVLLAAVASSDESGNVSYQLINGSPDSKNAREDCVLSLAVPDNCAIIKNLRFIPEPDLTFEDQLAFELHTTLLDPAELFQFDYHRLPTEHEYLGIIYRRHLLAELRESFSPLSSESYSTREYHLRSLALGRGYLKFTNEPATAPVVLIDLAATATSICFLSGQEIVGVAGLAVGADSLTNNHAVSDFVSELKTVVSFKLSGLPDAAAFREQFQLLTNHHTSNDDLDDSLKQVFGRAPQKVSVDRTLIETQVDQSPESYLVSLGLVVQALA